MKRLKSLMYAAVGGMLLLAGPTVLAHTDDVLAAQKAPNGGQLRMAGAYHLELVVVMDATEAKESPVVVYVTDHAGTKIPTVGASGTATILAGKQKASIKLAPDGDNRLKGVGKYTATEDMKVVVSITLSGKSAEQARFTPLAVAKDGHTGHKH